LDGWTDIQIYRWTELVNSIMLRMHSLADAR